MTTTNDFLVGLLNNIEIMCDEHGVPALPKLEVMQEIAERLAADDECYQPVLDEVRSEIATLTEAAKPSRTRRPRRKMSANGWNRGKVDQFVERLFCRPNKFEL